MLQTDSDERLYSLIFDGVDDYVDVPNRVCIGEEDEHDWMILQQKKYSFEFWAKMDLVDTEQTIISHGKGSNDYISIGLNANNQFSVGYEYIISHKINLDASYVDTAWHHWACVFDYESARQSCIIGYYLVFNRPYESIEIPYSDSLNFTNEITMEALVGNTLNREQSIFCVPDCFFFAINNNNVYAEITNSNDDKYRFDGIPLPPENETLHGNIFFHLALTWSSGNTMTLYINGKKVKSIPVENYPIKSMNEKERKVHIGYNNNSNYPVSNSGVYLNELRMWNVARSEEDIQKNMALYVNTDQPELVGYWKIVEMNIHDLAVHDFSSYRNNGYYSYISEDQYFYNNLNIDMCILEVRVYRDGILIDTFHRFRGPYRGNYILNIGKNRKNKNYFKGELNDVRIWEVGRTQEEIQENMSEKLTGSEEGLIAYWRFDEGSGNTVKDKSNNNYTGNLVNMDLESAWYKKNMTYLRRIYRNAKLVADDQSFASINSNGQIVLGKASWNNDLFHGNIDDLRIWDSALTEQQLQKHKNKPLSGNEQGLVGYWQFDQAGFSYVNDQSGNRNIGILQNMDASKAWAEDPDNPPDPATGDPNSESLLVRVVETRLWDDELKQKTAIIGNEITSTYHDPTVLHNGYIFWNEISRYNANIYDPQTKTGSIIPVNQEFTETNEKDDLVVVWYREQDHIYWPWQSVEYQCYWPENEKRIVIASRLGSDGKDHSGLDQTYPDINNTPKNYFDPARYKNLEIYHQPDPNLPGYNPNEEHALIEASFRNSAAAPRPQAVFALRNDLNIKTHDKNYTSDPYALAQYYDVVKGKYAMAAYKVDIKDDACGYNFHYTMKAGDPIVPPYPLDTVIGVTPPDEIFGKNSDPDKKCYWKDHKGQAWAISGAGKPVDIQEVKLSTDSSMKSENNQSVNIPDNFYNGITVNLDFSNLPTDAIISKVKYSIIIKHTFVGDLLINLVNANSSGQIIKKKTIWNKEGGSNHNITITEAYEDDLFKGLSTNNNKWYFHVIDNANNDTGSVDHIELTLFYSLGETNASTSCMYQVKLESEQISPTADYLLQVNDLRGPFGSIMFRKDSLDVTNTTSGLKVNQVFLDSFIVTLNPGDRDLNEKNFKLFRYDSDAHIVSYFWYPLHSTFWLDAETPGNGYGNIGQSIPWLPEGTVDASHGFPFDLFGKDKAVEVRFDVTWPQEVPVLKAGETLTFPGGEYRADHPSSDGLPGILGWASGQVVYDALNPSMNSGALFDHYLVRLVPALLERKVSLSLYDFPENLKPSSNRVDVVGTRWFFKDLHSSLKPRIFYDHMTGELGIRGFVNDKTLGDDSLTAAPPSIYVLQPNIMTVRERDIISDLDGANEAFKNAVQELYQMSRNPYAFDKEYAVGVQMYKDQLIPMLLNHSSRHKYIRNMFRVWLGSSLSDTSKRFIPEISFGPGLTLVPNAGILDPNNATFSSFTEGYVTIAENNHPDLGSLPVALHIIKIKKDKYRGAIKRILSENVFDEKITLRHSADFGANSDDLVFQWYYREEDGEEEPTPDVDPDKWKYFPDPDGNDGKGMSEISLEGAGAALLVDNLFYVRYRHKNADEQESSSWSNWAGSANSFPGNYKPQLAEGWVKRVLNAINPFEARIKDFYNTDNPATYVRMIQQAGPKYEGQVAFNPDKNVIENVGLIELYQTVLTRAMDLSIELDPPASTSGVTTALLLAATRIADFYKLLGDEAYTDALDPTIGYGTDSRDYGSLAPTIFCFMNQVPTLLDEELILLRGRDENGARPAYNRLLWNFTQSHGEVAYAMSYYITDENKNGFIDEADGRALYPQGHGDAWGHYLTALKGYYDLLGHPFFNWESRSEKFSIEGVVIDVDYLDERKFAEIASAKAVIGTEIMNLTYRSKYVENPDGQYQGYKDTDPNRAWGVSGWGRRCFQGALFDWAMANAILPSQDDENNGIKKIDRETTPDILKIASQARHIQNQYENANNGLNPLGLSSEMVPFDIDPLKLESSTQFEQIYERCKKALDNAQLIFNHANNIKNRIRRNSITAEDFTEDVLEQDMDFRNRLIAIFGTPYDGTIGPGQPYPAGYKGPDYYYYQYINVNEVTEQTVVNSSRFLHAYFQDLNIKNYDISVNENGDKTTFEDSTITSSRFFDSDLSTFSSSVDFLSGTLEVAFPIKTNQYAFDAPEEWGERQSPGEIQLALMDILQSEVSLKLAISDYNVLLQEIKSKIELMAAKDDLHEEQLAIRTWKQNNVMGFNRKIRDLNIIQTNLQFAADTAMEIAEAAVEGLPKVIGLSSDTTSGARATLKIAGSTKKKSYQVAELAKKNVIYSYENKKSANEFKADIELQKANYKYDIQQQLKEVENLLATEVGKRLEIFSKRENTEKAAEKFKAILSKGLRLLEERKVFNAKVAAKTQGKRYQDMAFRVSQNEALSKYRNAFDIAARYAYMAAKAYDYETNLSDRDPASAKPLLTNIFRERHLGQNIIGEYVVGRGGLGDIMARLKINFDSLKTQMGFNNAQTETGRFSLRKELFRIEDGDQNDDRFEEELEKHYKRDLWMVPEFRKYCRPFTTIYSEKETGSDIVYTEQPGIVIEFDTNIMYGKNFFGWPLSGGDHAYDPTNFATKIRSVGLWFENYDLANMSETPRVYLIPAGMDIMLVPNSTEFDHRLWTIVDQKLPVPLPVGDSDLNNPDWYPSIDNLDSSLVKIRKYSSFRAYHDNGYLDESQVNYDSRLVGRSVWNTKWMLVIPGGTFNHDPEQGIRTFIENITDIKLYFHTYAISGN